MKFYNLSPITFKKIACKELFNFGLDWAKPKYDPSPAQKMHLVKVQNPNSAQ